MIQPKGPQFRPDKLVFVFKLNVQKSTMGLPGHVGGTFKFVGWENVKEELTIRVRVIYTYEI